MKFNQQSLSLSFFFSLFLSLQQILHVTPPPPPHKQKEAPKHVIYFLFVTLASCQAFSEEVLAGTKIVGGWRQGKYYRWKPRLF